MKHTTPLARLLGDATFRHAEETDVEVNQPLAFMELRTLRLVVR